MQILLLQKLALLMLFLIWKYLLCNNFDKIESIKKKWIINYYLGSLSSTSKSVAFSLTFVFFFGLGIFLVKNGYVRFHSCEYLFIFSLPFNEDWFGLVIALPHHSRGHDWLALRLWVWHTTQQTIFILWTCFKWKLWSQTCQYFYIMLQIVRLENLIFNRQSKKLYFSLVQLQI